MEASIKQLSHNRVHPVRIKRFFQMWNRSFCFDFLFLIYRSSPLTRQNLSTNFTCHLSVSFLKFKQIFSVQTRAFFFFFLDNNWYGRFDALKVRKKYCFIILFSSFFYLFLFTTFFIYIFFLFSIFNTAYFIID